MIIMKVTKNPGFQPLFRRYIFGKAMGEKVHSQQN